MTDKKPSTDRLYYLFALRIVGDFSVNIAIPAVVLAWAGRYVDEKYGTVPWFMFGGLFVAMVFTTIIIKRKSKMYGEEFEKINELGRKGTGTSAESKLKDT